MKIENASMRGFHPGVIAGFFGGMTCTGILFLLSLIGYGYVQDFSRIDVLINFLIYELGLVGILGGIFGIVYSKFYNKIPGKGIKKGLLFGLIIGMLSNIWTASSQLLTWLFTGFNLYLVYGIANAECFGVWITYGLVLGLVYERWK